MAVFNPNLTSKLLLKSSASLLAEKSGDVLELGCGSGWITGQLLLRDRAQAGNEYWMSDISQEAVDVAKKNYIPPLSEENFAVGNGLDPWLGRSFDVIISDIAGISEPLAKCSSWYEGIPCETGIDGLDNARRLMTRLMNHLNEGGLFITPIISLTDTVEHLALLRSNFSQVHVENRKYWPLPEDLLVHNHLIQELRLRGQIDVEAKYGKLLAYTEIALCSNA
jgi:SAM-dependent methyltransferase